MVYCICLLCHALLAYSMNVSRYDVVLVAVSFRPRKYSYVIKDINNTTPATLYVVVGIIFNIPIIKNRIAFHMGILEKREYLSKAIAILTIPTAAVAIKKRLLRFIPFMRSKSGL